MQLKLQRQKQQQQQKNLTEIAHAKSVMHTKMVFEEQMPPDLSPFTSYIHPTPISFLALSIRERARSVELSYYVTVSLSWEGEIGESCCYACLT